MSMKMERHWASSLPRFFYRTSLKPSFDNNREHERSFWSVGGRAQARALDSLTLSSSTHSTPSFHFRKIGKKDSCNKKNSWRNKLSASSKWWSSFCRTNLPLDWLNQLFIIFATIHTLISAQRITFCHERVLDGFDQLLTIFCTVHTLSSTLLSIKISNIKKFQNKPWGHWELNQW